MAWKNRKVIGGQTQTGSFLNLSFSIIKPQNMGKYKERAHIKCKPETLLVTSHNCKIVISQVLMAITEHYCLLGCDAV
jgi:hypothetical protein